MKHYLGHKRHLYFLAEPWKKNNIGLGKRQEIFCERETLGTKGRGGSEHFVLGIAQLSLIRVRGACWGIMENNASKTTSPSNSKATDCIRPLILEVVIYDEVDSRKT